MAERARATDTALRERASAVIPNGMYGHHNAAYLPPNFPQFFSRGEGAHLWDADGNRYIDYLCAYGPILLGYKHPAVGRGRGRGPGGRRLPQWSLRAYDRTGGAAG